MKFSDSNVEQVNLTEIKLAWTLLRIFVGIVISKKLVFHAQELISQTATKSSECNPNMNTDIPGSGLSNWC